MPPMHVYEVRPRKDRRGADLISDALHSVGCSTASRMTVRAVRFDEPLRAKD